MDNTEERFYNYYSISFKGDFFMPRKSLVGQKFGKLTVIEMLYNYNNTNKTKCLCNCDCGAKNIIRTPYGLQHAKYSSCGCGKKEYIINSCGKDIIDQKFGRLLVTDIFWNTNPPTVSCLCDCGSNVILPKRDVQSGHTKSCGCLKIEKISHLKDIDHTNNISDYGIKILNKAGKNDKGQTLWECECFCGNHFIDLPARILNGHVRSCGCLIRSSRERLIENILLQYNVTFETQYSFPNCRSDKNYLLRFDFAIFKNNSLNFLLEYDGQQHFYPVKWFGGEDNFKETVRRDEIKNNYCINNNIVLIRLNYRMNENEIRDRIVNMIYP